MTSNATAPTPTPDLYLAHARALGLLTQTPQGSPPGHVSLLDTLPTAQPLQRVVVATYDADGHCHSVDEVTTLDEAEAFVMSNANGDASFRHRVWDLAAGVELTPVIVPTVRWRTVPRDPTSSNPPTP